MGVTQPYVRSPPPCCLVDKFHYQVFLGAVANAGAYDAAHILNQRGFVFALFVVPKDQLGWLLVVSCGSCKGGADGLGRLAAMI